MELPDWVKAYDLLETEIAQELQEKYPEKSDLQIIQMILTGRDNEWFKKYIYCRCTRHLSIRLRR